MLLLSKPDVIPPPPQPPPPRELLPAVATAVEGSSPFQRQQHAAHPAVLPGAVPDQYSLDMLGHSPVPEHP